MAERGPGAPADPTIELRDSEQRFRAIVDSTAAAVFVVRDELIVEVNRNACGRWSAATGRDICSRARCRATAPAS